MHRYSNRWLKRPIITSVGLLAIGCLAGLAAQGRLGDSPDLDTSFTYQGQIRDAGIPINDSADVSLSLWNAAADGSMVGAAQQFEGVVLVEGRFAVEPDFGPEAFNGSNRWIEIAFRSPSGVGDFVTLTPRQAVNAVPYALYALNGRIGPEGPQGESGDDRWTLDPDTGAISYMDGSVGIGTTSPTGAFEVVGAAGDMAVELPDQAISSREILGGLPAAGVIGFNLGDGGSGDNGQWEIDVPHDGYLLVCMTVGTYDCNGVWITMDGEAIAFENSSGHSGGATWMAISTGVIPVSAGLHTVDVEASWADAGGFWAHGTVTFSLFSQTISVGEVP